jgi:acyl transferase domain-containing protein
MNHLHEHDSDPSFARVGLVLVLLFPGQGSHTDGDRAEVEALAPEQLARCIQLLGEDPFPRVPESTRFAQPALLVTSIARARAMDLPAAPGAFAGHSLGELGALVAAGALSSDDGLRLVIARGNLMAQAKAGAMVAVRADAERAAPLAAAHGWVVANDNAPGQTVLSGAAASRDALVADAESQGIRALPLPVTGAFHSPLMAGAAKAFAAALERVTFNEPIAPVWCGATAAPFVDPRRQLAEALTLPVRWREVLLTLDAAGATTFADVGPGQVIDGLTRRTLPRATRLEVLDVAV